MSEEEDLFEDVPEALNPDPSPPGSFPSTPFEFSGTVGSRHASPAVQSAPAASGSQQDGFVCPVCSKVLRSKSGFTRHNMVHKLNDYASRKPVEEEILKELPAFLKCIIQEIKSEPNVSEMGADRVKFCDNFVLETAHCELLLKDMSTPILNALLTKNRVLPSAQYEEAVSAVNALLNKPEFLETVKQKLVLCVHLAEEFSDKLLNRMVWRITSKLVEKIQERIFHQMKVNHLTAHAMFSMNESDTEAYKDHIGNILRGTFRFGGNSQNRTWKLRCDCLKTRFVVAPQEVTSQEFMDRKLWTPDGICLSPACFSLFMGLERVIQKMHDSGVATTADNVLDSLTTPDNILVLNQMRCLSQGILSEDAAIDFLKDIIRSVAGLSGKLEARRKFNKSLRKQPAALVSLRTNLKRNPNAAKPKKPSAAGAQKSTPNQAAEANTTIQDGEPSKSQPKKAKPSPKPRKTSKPSEPSPKQKEPKTKAKLTAGPSKAPVPIPATRTSTRLRNKKK